MEWIAHIVLTHTQTHPELSRGIQFRIYLGRNRAPSAPYIKCGISQIKIHYGEDMRRRLATSRRPRAIPERARAPPAVHQINKPLHAGPVVVERPAETSATYKWDAVNHIITQNSH